MYERKERINITRIDQSPYLDMFNVFEDMQLQGLTLVQAMNAIATRAQELYKNVKNNSNVKQINAYKNDNGRLVEVITDEKAIISSINSSLAEFDYDGAIWNLEALANFYKNAYYHAKVYESFFDYMIKLMKRFNEISSVIKDFERIKFELDNLKRENNDYAKNFEEEKLKREIAEKRLLQYSKHFKNSIANERILKFFLANVNRITQKSNLNFTIMQLVVMLLYEGRMQISDILKTFNLNKKEFKNLVKTYEDLFVIIDDVYIDLNLKHEETSKRNIVREIDEYLKSLGLDKIYEANEKIEEEEDEVEEPIVVEDAK